MPWGELGYQEYHAQLTKNPDYGYLINQHRIIAGIGGYAHSNPAALLRLALTAQEIPPFKRILWLEHDHTFPFDVFQRHATYQKPVVSGLYVYRDASNPIPVLYKWDEGRNNAFYYNAVELEQMGIFDEMGSPRRTLHKVDVVPMGCLSVAREVYEQWPDDRPFFTSYTQAIGSHKDPRVSTVGHDVYACRIMQDAGWPIYVDTSLRVKHYARIELDDTYFAKWYRTVRLPSAIKELEAAGITPLKVLK
jgi:hypothetical protein